MTQYFPVQPVRHASAGTGPRETKTNQRFHQKGAGGTGTPVWIHMHAAAPATGHPAPSSPGN
eukprot:1159179-Pelagomonas_calceolata.AAC.2